MACWKKYLEILHFGCLNISYHSLKFTQTSSSSIAVDTEPPDRTNLTSYFGRVYDSLAVYSGPILVGAYARSDLWRPNTPEIKPDVDNSLVELRTGDGGFGCVSRSSWPCRTFPWEVTDMGNRCRCLLAPLANCLNCFVSCATFMHDSYTSWRWSSDGELTDLELASTTIYHRYDRAVWGCGNYFNIKTVFTSIGFPLWR